MSKYIIHDHTGTILRVIDVPDEVAHLQVQEGEFLREAEHAEPHWHVDIVSGQVIEQDEPPAPVDDPVPEVPEYAQLRATLYPSIGEQLDMLWHAMDRGEIPKATDFYERIKLVKDMVPADGDLRTTFINVVKPVTGGEQ